MLIGQAPSTVTEPFSLPTSADTNPSTNPYLAPVDAITLAASPAQQLRWLTHRRASDQYNVLALYYYRESAWHYMPQQPIHEPRDHPVLSRQYRTPATISFALADPQGLLVPENKNSVYNFQSDGTTYDPLLDEARKICLRSGTRCYANLASGIGPNASTAPSGGSLNNLTDDTFADIATTTTGFCIWNSAATQIDVTIDFGSPKRIRHLAARFAAKSGTCSLPDSAQVGLSSDGTNFVYGQTRLIASSDGDWDQPTDAIVIHECFTDIEATARFVRLRINKQSANILAMDELAVYGGSSTAILGANVFTGYLGDSIDTDAFGIIRIRATDVMKRLQDNWSNRLTAQYTSQDASEIVYSLLTSTQYWKGAAGAYDAPFTTSEIGWSFGTKLTGFNWPVWQGQANSMYGYMQVQPNEIGWEVWGDGSGVVQMTEPPSAQMYPTHLLRASDDAMNEVRHCQRRRAGKLLRNRVEVYSGQPDSGAAGEKFTNPTSVKRYGERTMQIVDSIASTVDIRAKIGLKVLRDYAWRVQSLQAAIRSDPYMRIRQVFGFRATARPNLYPKKCATAGKVRDQELWYTTQYDEHYTVGEISAQASFEPYVAYPSDPPTGLSVTSDTSGNITVTWTPPSGITNQSYYNFYVSHPDNSHYPTTPTASVLNSSLISTYTFYGGLATSTNAYLYMTVTSPNGQESIESEEVNFIQGGSADGSGWAITDLSASITQVDNGSGNALPVYQLALTWDTPSLGMKAVEFRVHVSKSPPSLPSDPTNPNSWDYVNEWHGDLIAPGTHEVWPLYITPSVALTTGDAIYVRIFSWATTHDHQGPSHASNVATIILP